MAQATVDNNTCRRDFLALAAAVATTAITARPALASPPHGTPDPVFDLIEQYKKARHALQEAEFAHRLVEREMKADGTLFPRTVSIGNKDSGLPRPVSTSHADIDMYTPADLFPQDNKREHEEMSAAIALRDSRLKPLETAMDDACSALDETIWELVNTVPTTLAGVLALLKVQRDYSDGMGCLESDVAAALMSSVETALLDLQLGEVA